MSRLGDSDVHAVLDFVHAASSAEAADPFPAPVLERLARIVPAEIIGYSEWTITPRPSLSSTVDVPRVATPQDVANARARYCSTYPLSIVRRTSEARPLKISDFLTRSRLHQLDYYDQVLRPLDIEYQLRLWLPAPRGCSRMFQFSRRCAQGDFRERDRVLLEFLRPFVTAIRERFEFRASTHPDAANALTDREAEILHWVARGKTNKEVAFLLFVSPDTVGKHLENAYRKLGVHTRTAAVARLHAGPVEPAPLARLSSDRWSDSDSAHRSVG